METFLNEFLRKSFTVEERKFVGKWSLAEKCGSISGRVFNQLSIWLLSLEFAGWITFLQENRILLFLRLRSLRLFFLNVSHSSNNTATNHRSFSFFAVWLDIIYLVIWKVPGHWFVAGAQPCAWGAEVTPFWPFKGSLVVRSAVFWST